MLNLLTTLNHEERFDRVKQGIKEASELIRAERAFVINIADITKAGGLHNIRLLAKPMKREVCVEIPEEPIMTEGIKGGRTPTILHAIELIVLSYKLAQKKFPTLSFKLYKTDPYDEKDTLIPRIFIPLTIDPPKTNIIIFHTQVPHINPELLAQSWFEIMKQDESLENDFIRHTILVMPVSSTDQHQNNYFQIDQPKLKTQAHIIVLPKEIAQDRSRFRVMHLNRISRWTKIHELNLQDTPVIEKITNGYLMNLL